MAQQARRRGAGFDHRAIRCQVAVEHSQRSVLTHRVFKGPNDSGILHLRRGDVLRNRLASHRELLQTQLGADDFHERGQATGIVEVFHQAVATWKQVGQHGHHSPHGIKIVQPKSYPGAARHGNDVHSRVGRAAQRHLHRHGILEGTLGEYACGGQVFPDHAHNALAATGCHAGMGRVHGRYAACAGQCKAQGLNNGGHG